ncbi:MAG: CDP-alcohol phosphatidyltransferase family protein [Terriglobales bacterium]
MPITTAIGEANSMVDFAEQINPSTLSEIRQSEIRWSKIQRLGFRQAARVHRTLLASVEARALVWMAKRIPSWVNSDHLTALGFVAQIATGICYAFAARDRRMLLAAIVCLAVNWFGDSLDGTLARVRQHQRPRYGFYVDHMVDSFGAVAMMGGLALSGYMHPAIAIALLVAFLLLSIQSYLATYTLGEFQLSFWRFGPTELRVLLAIGNLALFRWACVIHGRYRLFDLGGVIGLAGMSLMLVFISLTNTVRLYGEERIG